MSSTFKYGDKLVLKEGKPIYFYYKDSLVEIVTYDGDYKNLIFKNAISTELFRRPSRLEEIYPCAQDQQRYFYWNEENKDVSVYIIGGGGSGQAGSAQFFYGGGGGAGGVVIANKFLEKGKSYFLQVGSMGNQFEHPWESGYGYGNPTARTGGMSWFDDCYAYGGAGAGTFPAQDGGSGAGGAADGTNMVLYPGTFSRDGSGGLSYGNDGADGITTGSPTQYIAGGGGGAGGAGGNWSAGLGISLNLEGTTKTYAAGGAGGNGKTHNYYGEEGSGGSAGWGKPGAGWRYPTESTGWLWNRPGKSGIVIIRYKYKDPESPYIVATGGTITTEGDYKIHTFTSSGTFTVTDGGDAAALIVGGGGGSGGYDPGGSAIPFYAGGGGGGYVKETTFTLSTGNYTVTVGAGGTAGSNSNGGGGGTSTFNSVSSSGGYGSVGGSFGSKDGANSASGNTGGAPATWLAGGAGGGGGNAGNGASGDAGGAGGSGSLSSITGLYYGGGGGGASPLVPGAAGNGFVGGGANGNGGDTGSNIPGNAGNPGIVVIKYKYK